MIGRRSRTVLPAGRAEGSRLAVDRVSKSFGARQVLRDVSFAAEPASLTVLLGPSGQGKTTMLRLIAGFERPDSGTISIDDAVLADASTSVAPQHRGIGYVPQDAALFPHLDVAHNIGYGLPRSSGHRIDEMLRFVGLSEFRRHRPSQLSGGQRQRVALARALAPSPRLVLLDEPFSALDATMRADVRSDAISILRASGTTAVMVTHDQEEAMAFADHLVVLLDGGVAQAGPPTALYDAPVSLAVARFIGQANLLTGTATSGTVRFDLGSTAWDGPDGPVTVLVRPEHVRLVGPDDPGVDGLVESRSYYGHDGSLSVRLGTGAEVTARVRTDGLVPVGARVRLTADQVTRVFDEVSEPHRPGVPRLSTPD